MTYFANTSNAQVANYSFAQSSGTYTPITGGTVLGTATSTGSLDSDIFTIATASFPFTFTFNEIGYTGCVVNSNGYITFGTTAPSGFTSTAISSTTAYAGAIAAWSRDINGMFNVASTTSQIRWETVGTTPNREVVIQFKDFRPSYTTSTTAAYAMNFQIRLQETSNKVIIVYGGFTNLLGTTNYSGTITTGPQVGLRGATNTDFNNRTGTSWATTTAGTTNDNRVAYQTFTAPINVPANGLTFTWSPPAACTGTPTAGTAATSAASVTCAGSTVNLSVTGATLASGITYQWQFATLVGGPYTDITGATTSAYTASVSASGFYRATITCTNSSLSASTNAVNVTVTTSATYAAIPLTESFEGAWATTCVTAPLGQDAVNASWRSSPSSGNTSWRADNTTTALSGWTSISGAYTPVSSNGARSARFHSYNATAGTQGTLDLYVNLSNAGTKQLSFDFINPSGTDVLAVFISTDGGATFNPLVTSPASLGVAATWTGVTASIASTSATAVIRFRATSDFGDNDIGLDNVSITLPCSGTPTAGTASASLTTLCAGGSSNLSLTGATVGAGITYQWQVSPDGIAPYVNIIGATSSSYSATNITTTGFYKAVVTCTPSSSSSTSTAVQITVLSATYAAIPLTESFEAAWATTCVTAPLGQDAVNASWRTSPTSGNTSWRADNTTTALSGWGSINGAYTPVSSNGARSARFHSYNATNGTQGNLDLYVNLSNAGTKQLRFDFINPSGTDVLALFISEDGGATFNPLVTSPASLGVAATWTNVTASITSTSATAVIRFRGTADFGANDIGLDNVSITLPCSGTPTAGTANAALLSICNSTSIGVTGASTGPGITYQWESSTTSATTGFADVATATAITYLAPVPTVPTWYRLKTTCTNGNITSTATTTEVRPFTSVTTYPYNENFDTSAGIPTIYTPLPTNNPTNGDMPCGWTVENVNGDANTWYNFNSLTGAASSPNAIIYRWNTTSAANDWAFTPQFTFTAGRTYTLSFKAKASDGPTYQEGLEVRWGTAANPASMLAANTIFDNTTIGSVDDLFATFTATSIVPTVTGTYYIGFLAKSLANQGILYVDDIQVIESCPTIAITPLTLPNGSVNVAYSQTATQTGLTGAVTWSVSAGSLPTGLTLNTTTGAITGTPTALGTANFTLQVAQGSCTATRAYTVVIGCPTVVFSPLAATGLPNATVDVAYTTTVSQTTLAAVTWSATGLPTGFSIDATTGVISGTATAASSSSVVVTATGTGAFSTCSGNVTYNLVVGCPTLVFTMASAPSGEISTPYTFNAGVTGNTAAVVYSVSPALPAGITLNTATGVVSGTPSGTTPSTAYTVTATQGTCSVTKVYTFAVLCANFVIAPATLPNPTLGTAYTQTLTLTGNPLPAAWTISAGVLPAGITLNGATGEVSGTATGGGSFTFTITATQGTCTSTIVTNWTLGSLSSSLTTPDSPRNFKATTVSTTQINLTWQPVLQNATEYRLYRNSVLIATLPITAASYQSTGLTPDTFYSYTLIAVNQATGDIRLALPVSDNARTFPVAPVLISKTDVCGSGSSTVKVSSTGSTYLVYADSVGGSSLMQSTNGIIEFPSVSTTTTFYVSVFSNEQESARTAVRIVVQPSFVAKIVGESPRLSCDNSLELEAEEVADATYNWLFNGSPLAATGRTITATNTGQYQVRIQKGVCNLVSQVVTVRLNQNPIAKIQQQNGINFCENGTINAASTNSTATYEWLLNSVVVGEGTSVLVSQSGTYTLQVTQNGCQATTQIEVVITPAPQTPVVVATESTICPSTETTISVDNAVNGVTYQWFRNGRRISKTGSSITTSVRGRYSVVATSTTNAACSTPSNEVEITISEVETIYLRTSEDKKSLFLENAAGSQDGIASVEWYFEGELNAALGSASTITPTEKGNYSALVTNQNGCVIKTRTVYFSIPEVPVVVGQDDIKADLFRVYPNPSKGLFNVHFATVLTENTQVSIFDATGKVINTQIFEKGSQEFTIDIQKFAKGVYLIRFTQNDTVYSKSVIVE